MDFGMSRRQALQQFACGIGGIGLANFLAEQGLASEAPALAALPRPHHEPKAKSLIFLNMMGGPSQFETFDYKPEMTRFAGTTVQVEGARVSGNTPIMPSQWPFRRCGQSGHWVADIFPHMQRVADELCVIKSMWCEDNNHPGAQREIMTGFNRKVMPSFGSWITYGLGSENRNLPGFVCLAESTHHDAAFLPASNQGMPLSGRLPNLRRPNTISEAQQRGQLDLLGRLNSLHLQERDGDDVLHARIEAGELAFRMQMAAPEAIDLTQETAQTKAMYGIGVDRSRPGPGGRGLSMSTGDYGTLCLIARRLVERGVRVITINVGGRRGWDQHSNIKAGLANNAMVVDQPMAALIQDLRQRGLLDQTLVLWGGEFGRTPNMQSLAGDSRAHFTHGYTMWLAGGGSKKGTSYGITHDLGTDVLADRVHVHDLHATILHLMGLDHQRLTYRYAGRDQTLTDVHGQVVHGVCA